MTSFAADALLVAEAIAAVLVLRTFRRHARRPRAFADALDAVAAEAEPAPHVALRLAAQPVRRPALPPRAR